MIHGKNQRIRAFIKHFSIRPPRARDGAAAPPTHHPNILSRPHDIASFRWPHMLPLSPDRDVTRPAATILSSRRPSLKACPSSHRRTPQSSNHCVQKYSYQEFTFFFLRHCHDTCSACLFLFYLYARVQIWGRLRCAESRNGVQHQKHMMNKGTRV